MTNPNCENCNGTGKVPAINLDIHGDGMHDCFCVFDKPTAPAKDVRPECGGSGAFEHYAGPDDPPEIEMCHACHGTGKRPTN